MDINSLESFPSSSSQSSITSKVEFIDVQDHYSHNEDVICKYMLTDLESAEHDRVAIYKLGWKHVKEYVLFEWAPIIHEKVVTVIFNRPSLPKNTNEIYQFCYINADNEVCGASPPFQFVDGTVKPFTSITTSIYASKVITGDKDKEIEKLREENSMLKDTLKVVISNKTASNLQKDVDELKNTVKFLVSVLKSQSKEINALKQKFGEKQCERRKVSESSTQSDSSWVVPSNLSKISYDLGELETLPPFPLKRVFS